MKIDLIALNTGDMSVGIPNLTFTVEDVGTLDDYEGQREEVRMAFRDAFLTLVDNVKIVFSDEHKED
ncbi:hypothetical protein [Burkholderia contaminans]|uniref:hypothetical protein n=1 Tax=Burkholderia contaminans TaxID=488447 RepID=UPI0015887372|nr:hypothetical protein [Burkholderia contaminans]